MSNPTISLNYRYELHGRSLLEIIKLTAKDTLRMVGTTLESSAAIVTFLTDGTAINFHLASKQHLSVHAPLSRAKEAMKLCRQLVGRKILEPLHEKPSAPSKPAFAENITVLKEALDEAYSCVFEHEGTLDRYLAGLVDFAKLKADPVNAFKPNEFLARQVGLSHFGGGLGEHARIRYASDYAATYKGVTRLFPLHVTLGRGFSPRMCMSIYFDWDPEARKLILARFGRHGRGA